MTARDITVQEAVAVQIQLRGRHLIENHRCYYPPEVTAEDVLDINFDRRTIHEGLYVIAYPGTGERYDGPWHGVRRFQRMPTKGLMIFEGGKWVPIHDGHRGMIVLGHVVNVYRQTTKMTAGAA